MFPSVSLQFNVSSKYSRFIRDLANVLLCLNQDLYKTTGKLLQTESPKLLYKSLNLQDAKKKNALSTNFHNYFNGCFQGSNVSILELQLYFVAGSAEPYLSRNGFGVKSKTGDSFMSIICKKVTKINDFSAGHKQFKIKRIGNISSFPNITFTSRQGS